MHCDWFQWSVRAVRRRGSDGAIDIVAVVAILVRQVNTPLIKYAAVVVDNNNKGVVVVVVVVASLVS